jgi:hypothetical protein
MQPAVGAAVPEIALPPLPTVDATDSAALHTLEQTSHGGTVCHGASRPKG